MYMSFASISAIDWEESFKEKEFLFDRTICHVETLALLRFYKNYFQSLDGFSLFMLTWGTQKLYPSYSYINDTYFFCVCIDWKPLSIRCAFWFLNSQFQVKKIFSENAFDAVMHFAAVAYVGESTVDPLK